MDRNSETRRGRGPSLPVAVHVAAALVALFATLVLVGGQVVLAAVYTGEAEATLARWLPPDAARQVFALLRRAAARG